MISLFDLWQKFIGTVNTHQGGHVKPHRNFVEWVNDISFSIFEEEYAVWEKTQQITDRLMPFLESVNVAITGVSGQMWDVVTLPAGYEHFSSARLLIKNGTSCGDPALKTIDGCTGKETRCAIYLDDDEKALLKREADANICEIEITKVKNNQWGAICGHKTNKPTLKKPILTQYAGGLKLAPKGLGVIVLDHLRLPLKGTFAYTVSNPGTENEYIQYDAANSQELEWSETLVNEIVTRLEKKFAKFVRDPQLYEQANNDKETTV